MHSELSQGGDKVRRSHHIPGWNRPSPGGQGEEAALVVRPRPSPACPPDGPGSHGHHAHILPDATRSPAAGVGAGGWNWSGPRAPPPSLGPQKGLHLTSPGTGSPPHSILFCPTEQEADIHGGWAGHGGITSACTRGWRQWERQSPCRTCSCKTTPAPGPNATRSGKAR